MREKLFSDEGVLLSTEEEREKINQALSEASDWLDDEGWDSTADVSQNFCFLLLLVLFDNLRNLFSRAFWLKETFGSTLTANVQLRFEVRRFSTVRHSGADFEWSKFQQIEIIILPMHAIGKIVSYKLY